MLKSFFLPHFGVVCDLSMNRNTATQHLFVRFTGVCEYGFFLRAILNARLNCRDMFYMSVFSQEKRGDFLDCFIPNPSCDSLHMFHWLGVLMGGTFRSDESLTLAFPPFVWKLIVGEHVTWAKDYLAIDEAAVQITGETWRFLGLVSTGLREDRI